MRTTLITLMVIVFMCFASVAVAEEAITPAKETKGPVMMTDAQLDNVVGAGPAWGYDNRNYSYFLDSAPGNNQKATNNYRVGDVTSARPVDDLYGENRTNYHSSYKNNAYFDD